ncbi:hypothetical protein T12_13587 [Trichinella patagoniensis]|uniref:Uncharacterized protein n=1 Tax=Trichinella patagoniensis TaxID=990121 RepID=A0A0V0ZWU9_9BILA|nr:hypothetical protein T12_13587 [Trichinella patagoniensis]
MEKKKQIIVEIHFYVAFEISDIFFKKNKTDDRLEKYLSKQEEEDDDDEEAIWKLKPGTGHPINALC